MKTLRARARVSAALAAALVLASASPCRAAEPLPLPWDRLGGTAVRAFTGESLTYYVVAGASTIALAQGGADHAVRVAIAPTDGTAGTAFGDGAVTVGYVLPVALPASIYLAGLALGDRPAMRVGALAMQAVALTVTVTSLLKVATGRPFPLHGRSRVDPDRLAHPEEDRAFNAFDPARGLAWPSGHTSAAFALAAAFAGYYVDDAPWVPFVAYPAAAAMGAGMLLGDHHYASDVLAGALLGQGIGFAAGREARAHARGDARAPRAALLVAPAPGAPYARGAFLSFAGSF